MFSKNSTEALLEIIRAQQQQITELQSQIRLVLEDRFYRPAIGPATEQAKPSISPEELTDVETFDAEADAEMLKELKEIEEEHAEWRKG